MTVYSALSEDECYLWAIMSDESGLDQAEFAFTDETQPDACFRAWPFQWAWWRNDNPKQIDRGSRSCGKSLSIKFRAFAFPFVAPGEEMVITAPEGVHLDAVTDNIETLYTNNRLAREMISKGRGGIKHRPFMINFQNGGRIIGRIPQRDGKGMKGTHPLWLEQDEACLPADTLILTKRGHVPIVDVCIGDEVWTHLDRWRKVTNTWDRGMRETLRLSGHGHQHFVATDNHRFWAKSPVDWKDRKNKWGPKFDGTSWVRADQMQDAFWASPTAFDGVRLEDAVIPRGKTGTSYEINVMTLDFMWALGLYIAEGSVSKDAKTTWSIHVDEVSEVVARLTAAGLRPFVQPVKNTENCKNVVVAHRNLNAWVRQNVASGAANKNIPMWVFSLPSVYRQAFLDGMIFGDGCVSTDSRYGDGRFRYTTVSKALAYETRLLAQSLGLSSTVYIDETCREMFIRGQRFNAGRRFEVVVSKKGQGYLDNQQIFTKIKEVKPNGLMHVYDIEVEEDHSFVAEGVVVHNSDYPEQAWNEIIETVKKEPGARWRAHGVTRGIGGGFDERCQPDSGWFVHALPAMYRPNWDDEERFAKIKEYGGHADAVDYRRNVLGLPGDQNSPIFVLYRLMAAVDTNVESDYNTLDYVSLDIDESMVRDIGDIVPLLDLPGSHRKYKNFWMGMDVGWTLAPSSIVIFAEENDKKTQQGKLRLIARILLKKVATQDQTAAIIHLIDTYRPRAFALDSTGAGFPLFENVQDAARKHPELKHIVPRIKGYNFSQKIIAEFDDTIEIDEYDPEGWKEAAIHRSVLEWSTDVLRSMVDDKRVVLPYDKSIIGEFQGQTWTFSKSALDPYGRKKLYSSGSFHTLDACRMAVLAYQQEAMDQFVSSKEDDWTPPTILVG